MKKFFLILPATVFCSCGGFSKKVPAAFTSPEAAELAQMAAAEATGISAEKLTDLSPQQIETLRSLSSQQVAKLMGVNKTELQSQLSEISAANDISPETLETEIPVALKAGMTKEQVRAVLGRPSYQYSLGGEETWVYEKTGFVKKQIQSTGLNLVPFIGPVTSLVGNVLESPAKETKAAVTFDADEKVISGKMNQ